MAKPRPILHLDHPLDGIKAKWQRAEENVVNLNAEINTFLKADPPPYRIIGKLEDDCARYVWRGYGSHPPLRFSVLAGEIIHQLRSCMDHLIVALAVKNGQRPLNQHEFPVCVDREKLKQAISRGKVQGIGWRDLRKVAKVQPYRSQTPYDSTIRVIHELDIRDKHSLLIVVAQCAMIGDTMTINADVELEDLTAFFEHRTITNDGGKLYSIGNTNRDPTFHPETNFSIQIAFDQIGSGKVVPVIPILTKMLQFTHWLVSGFAKEF